MYNFFSMKLSIAAIVTLSLAGFVAGAPDDLDDSYAKLKAAVEKKDPDEVKTSAAETLKLVKAAQAAPKPADADAAKDWESRATYDKEVENYIEYALAFTAEQGGEPAKTVELIDVLLAENPKSKYLDDICANAYLAALGKTGGSAKQLEGMAKIAAGRPDNVVALTALVEGYSQKNPGSALNYANKLLAAARKAKPEGLAEGDWEKARNAALATGYYYGGLIYGQRQAWIDCDKNLTAAMPLIAGDQSKTGVAEFTLGFCKYSFGKLTNDRTKMQAGAGLVEKSAGIKSPLQDQAYKTSLAMKQELAARR
jgi:hypothetical protein